MTFGASTTGVPAHTRPRSGAWQKFARFAATQPLGAAGLLTVVVMAMAGALAPYIAPYDPVAISFGDMLAPPSWEPLVGAYRWPLRCQTRSYALRTPVAWMLSGAVAAYGS